MDLPFEGVLRQVVQSGLLIAAAIALRVVVIHALQRVVPASEVRLRWLVSIRNLSVLVILAGLAAIWAQALQTFWTIVLALGVGFVIATKELLQCLTGSIVRAASKTYSIGDRIEIGAFRGDVIDLNAFTTTLLEVGPGKSMHLRTGRTITVPNMKLLDTPVVNESTMRRYVIHVMTIPVDLKADWQRAEEILIQAATDISNEYADEARASMASMETAYGLKGLPVQPRAHLQVTEPTKGSILLRFPAPVGQQGRLEQEVLRRYLTEMKALEPPKAEPSTEGEEAAHPGDSGAV